MFKKIFAKIYFFGILLLGVGLLSGCSQPTVGPAPQQTSTTTVTNTPKSQVQVNTRTRAS